MFINSNIPYARSTIPNKYATIGGSMIKNTPTIIAIIPIIARYVLEFMFYFMYKKIYNFDQIILNPLRNSLKYNKSN